MRTIPILWNHDPTRRVGRFDAATGIMTFEPRTVTEANIFNCGFRALQYELVDGVRYITRAELMELSVG